MPRPDRKEGSGEFGREVLNANQDHNHRDSDGESDQRGVGKMSDQRDLGPQEAALLNVKPKYLR